MSKYQRITLFLLINIICFPLLVYPQYWKKAYYESIYGLGTSNMMSDVGGPNPDLSGFLEKFFWITPQALRPIIFVGGRYNFNSRMSIKVNFAFANLAAADIYGGYRSVNRITNTILIELSGQYEYFVIEEKRRKNIYRISTYKWYKNLNIPTYFFIGIGESLFFSNTQANERYIGVGKFSGTFDPPEKYIPTSPVMPFGIGVRFRLNKVIRFGIEAGFRLTITDYLDQVKDGRPDAYQFLLFTLNYKLKTGKSGLPQFRFK